MAVGYCSAVVDEAALAAVLAPVSSVDDLLSAEVFEAVLSVRFDPAKSGFLAHLRLDPRDSELWSMVEVPGSDDFERESAAAHRLTVLLTSLAQPSERAIVPYYASQALDACGWSSEEVSACVFGTPTSRFLVERGLIGRDLAADLQDWLPGGWLRPEEAARFADKLAQVAMSSDGIRERVASVAEATRLSPEKVAQIMSSSLDALLSVHELSASDQSLRSWVVVD